LGSILYEALSGRSPFGGENIPQIIYRIVHEKPEPLASLMPLLAPKVVASIERAMAKKVADRYPDVETFIEELTGSRLQTLSNSTPGERAALPVEPKTEDAPLEPTFISQKGPRPPSEPPGKPEEVASPSPSARPPSGRRIVVPAVGAVILVAAGATFSWIRWHRETVVTPGPERVAVSPKSSDAGLAAAQLDAGVVTAPVDTGAGSQPEDSGMADQGVDGGAQAVVTRAHSAPALAPKLNALPPQVRAIFADAETLLKAGEWTQAIQRAQQAEGSARLRALPVQEQKLALGYSSYIQTRAYCATKNYSNWEDELRRVPRPWQRELEAFCGRQGLTRTK
jgi:hypothetical protein